jgi:hypothetical protein
MNVRFEVCKENVLQLAVEGDVYVTEALALSI